MTVLDMLVRGTRETVQVARAGVTLNNINLSQDFIGTTTVTPGRGHVDFVNGATANYEQIYRQQIWVAVAVNKIKHAVARLPLKVYKDPDNLEDGRERVRDGDLASLFAVPGPATSPFHWKARTVQNMCLFGHSIAVPHGRADRNKPPTEFTVTNFRAWQIFPDENWQPEYYVYTGRTGIRVVFYPEEVVHFHQGDPFGPSILEPLRRTLIVEDAAQRLNIASYANGARPSGALVAPADAAGKAMAPMNDAQLKRLRAELESVYSGVDEAFKIALFEGGLSWQPMSHNLVDSELISTKKLTREEIAAAYDVPQPNMGILERATFTNITEQHLMFYQDTLGPWIALIEETLHTQLIDREPAFAHQYVEFDMNEVLRGSFIDRMNGYSRSVGGPFLTPNEARAAENLKPLPGGDELYPSPTTPGGPDAAAGAPPEQAPTAAMTVTLPAINIDHHAVSPATKRSVRRTVIRDESGRISGVTEVED